MILRKVVRRVRAVARGWLGFVWRPLLAWAVAGALCVVVLEWVDVGSRASAREKYRVEVETAAEYISSFVADRVDRQTQWARAMLSGRRVTEAEMKTAATAMGYAAAGVTDGRGRLLAAAPSTPELLGKDVTPILEMVRVAVQQDRAGVSAVFVSPLIHRPVVAIGVPYRTPFGRRVFFGPVRVQGGPLSRYLQRTGVRRGEGVRLIDRNGNVIVAGGASADRITPLAAQAPALAQELHRRSSGSYRRDGAPWYFASAPVEGTGWRVVFSVPASALYREVDRTRSVYWWLLAGGMALTLAPALLVGRSNRRRAHEERRSHWFLEAAPEGIVVINGAGAIILVNAQIEKLFGYRREELLGRQVEVLVPEELRAVHVHHVRRFLAAGGSRPMGAGLDLSARRKDGSEFPIDVALSAFDTEHGVLGMAVIRDMSERKQMEADRERLRQQAEHQRAQARYQQSQRLESLGQLAGGIAHDFNNLIAIIAGYAEFLSEQCAAAAQGSTDTDWELAHRDAEQIKRAADRSAGLTRQLLAFGRREAAHPRVLDLNEVVDQVGSLLRRTLGEHIELMTRLETGPCLVEADPGQLEQVLVNLAVNARDAMPSGGVLTIRTSYVTINADTAGRTPGLRPGRYVQLQVSDTGTGMPPDVLAKAFDPFFTTKPKGAGTGLGLSTVYGIITKIEGTAEITSQAGRGTTITVCLPATDRGLETTEAAAPDALHITDGETILVVEDEPGIRQVTQRILTRAGYRVLTAGTGPQAVEIARSITGRIDLLLTDVVMPHMSGWQAAAEISTLHSETKVLYMSGYAPSDLPLHGAPNVHGTLIEKPFTQDTLLAAVQQVLQAPSALRYPPRGNADEQR